MKCKVCGAESGKYPLCRMCNGKKEEGEIIKCDVCGNWHYKAAPCPQSSSPSASEEAYLYETKERLISKSEQEFYNAIKTSVPDGYCVFPQINLATIISRTDDARFHNELFRNVDFLITDAEYQPKIIIEINDQTHLNAERKERDKKVQNICQEAGIPILKLWTSYGVNPGYIREKITETLNALPVKRIHHFSTATTSQVSNSPETTKKKQGCYIATCVYGSYDCPQVRVLRRYRDKKLSKTWHGKAFIGFYYAVSPTLVKVFGSQNWFKSFCFNRLEPIINKLLNEGYENTPYAD